MANKIRTIRISEISELTQVLMLCNMITKCNCHDLKCINCSISSQIQEALRLLDNIQHQ